MSKMRIKSFVVADDTATPFIMCPRERSTVLRQATSLNIVSSADFKYQWRVLMNGINKINELRCNLLGCFEVSEATRKDRSHSGLM
ncbi:hypothetical protein Bpfe_023958 [Biomphalaria pfeifferi]|uniref:Uncharacterized protein n=1 Tax=Biomphalaria pfeifferi TaxID=112525 RepID=A0AAD8F0W0_BIOPF|nr:hypothetical protein Bpfe_023958 [Biomphalaria pfeifferi]